MKKRLSRNELVKHILDTMPVDYNEYEKLAFVELEVAKKIAFDEQYLWGDIQTRQKIYRAAKKATRNLHSKVSKKLICTTMSELFGYVAKAVGFNVKFQIRREEEIKSGNNEILKSISHKTQEHVCTIVELSNGRNIEVDIQEDLYRLQTRCRPNAFGQTTHQSGIKVLPPYVIDQTFRKVYNLKENENFMDKHIRDLAIRLQYENKTLTEMLEIFIKDSKIQGQLKNVGCVEANRLFKKVLGSIYDFSEDNEISGKGGKACIDECVLSDSKTKKKYSFCLYAEDGTQKVLYIYSKKSKKMVIVTPEEIKRMAKKPMNLELRAKSLPLKQSMISYINSADEKAQTREKMSTISIKDIFTEYEEK